MAREGALPGWLAASAISSFSVLGPSDGATTTTSAVAAT